ncbi:biotin--[acetyl-CoA-carboxylase] ligase [Limosilactobacillus agrestis]|uniref:Bifunctional ligase/repressor BirA n=1 Tax=Limosilactobacillus agrestis TaxID=2759748 RepID=A0ABS8R8A7_9LACO|nr:biotin--[acetyl-CoA-carboxylase] ligase [Limosilactobacillus agrestis]MBD5090483.1 biotin--[acetyl-CoA-carboxylase] ligase [Lactobacillus sp.]MCD7113315.1 biotin--[acetyl-CoA-carboxylase] ligase [Limosilactobacillus agrestis]MCD7126652.1 biotin--[acetyl-CoA-carboxylase] ligase [Limosilactobacillus agrestis]MCD7131042.1 biotin--[acetyl-CoA-carboxylase] ligase [Limosilactobacillus agrestis]
MVRVLHSTAQKILLQLLSEPDSWVSGNDLAKQFNISRESVWKAINSLRKAGNNIVGRKNLGYHFVGNSQLNADIIDFYTHNHFANRLYVEDQVSSTQSIAKAFLSHHLITAPTVFIADHQTAGYGRQGRSFYSPATTGLYFSMILPSPTDRPLEAGLMTTTFAVLIVDVLKQFFPAQDFQYKWVNDIYLDYKKVGGILTEAVVDLESRTTASLVVGIGLNIATKKFPKGLKDKATGIAPADRNLLVSRLIEAIANNYSDYDNPQYLEQYRQGSMILGQKVDLLVNGEVITGIAKKIENDGSLTIVLADGKMKTFNSGEVVKVNFEK